MSNNTNIKNKKAILRALRDLGVKKVSICYSGSGDSGCIDHVSFDNNNADRDSTVVIEDRSSKFDHASQSWIDSSTQSEVPIAQAVETFCYDLLEEKHGGWENGAGADGSFELDVDSGEITWTHNEYYTESNTYEYKV